MSRVGDTSGACAPVLCPCPALSVTWISEVAAGTRLGRFLDTSAANSRCTEPNCAPSIAACRLASQMRPPEADQAFSTRTLTVSVALTEPVTLRPLQVEGEGVTGHDVAECRTLGGDCRGDAARQPHGA